MKEKIMYLILGILIGAVLTAGVFLVFSKSNMRGRPDGFMKNGERPNFEQMHKPEDGEEIPEKPNEENAPENIVSENANEV